MMLLYSSGNPGLLDFYPPFLSAIRDKDTSGKLAILAHGHIGHTPGLGNIDSSSDASRYCLTAQLQSAIEAFDALRSAFGSNTRIILVGHSMGSWIALQVTFELLHACQ